MTSQASRTTSVEIIDANNVVVGTTTTQADGSFSCTVPAGLGEHVFTARSGDETSSAYTVNGVPSQTIEDNFEDLSLQHFSPGVTLIAPVTQTSFTLRSGQAEIREEWAGNPYHHSVKLTFGDFEVRPKYPPKKISFRRSQGEGADITVKYYGKDDTLLYIKILDGFMFPVFESETPIYYMVIIKPTGTMMRATYVDYFKFYYN